MALACKRRLPFRVGQTSGDYPLLIVHYPCSPLTPGHEIIGRVAAVGEDVAAWKVGDRIGGGWHGGHDGGFGLSRRYGITVTDWCYDKGTCGACKKSLFQMCENEAINGVTRNGGCKFLGTRHTRGMGCALADDSQTPNMCSSAPKRASRSPTMSTPPATPPFSAQA